MKRLDEVDRSIIAHLQYDGRTPFTDIAAALGISEGAIRRRVKQMREGGILQVVGIVEPQHLGWNAAQMIGITVSAGEVEAVARKIARCREVSYLFQATGGFDLFAEVYCRDMAHFVSFLNEKLQKIPGVSLIR